MQPAAAATVAVEPVVEPAASAVASPTAAEPVAASHAARPSPQQPGAQPKKRWLDTVWGQVCMALIGAAIIAGFIIASLLIDEEDAEGRIQDANTAAGADGGPTEDFGTVSTFDLRSGDCFVSEAVDTPGGVELNEVERVPCDAAWNGRVVDSFLLDDGDYPEMSGIESAVAASCPPPTTYAIFPTDDTWDLGDRTVLCIEVR